MKLKLMGSTCIAGGFIVWDTIKKIVCIQHTIFNKDDFVVYLSYWSIFEENPSFFD
ncbi:MAG: hypothetical protein GX379_00055 [Clostridiales bacterium]|nr:hypothetical protein [Clostridiales bacterium]